MVLNVSSVLTSAMAPVATSVENAAVILAYAEKLPEDIRKPVIRTARLLSVAAQGGIGYLALGLLANPWVAGAAALFLVNTGRKIAVETAERLLEKENKERLKKAKFLGIPVGKGALLASEGLILADKYLLNPAFSLLGLPFSAAGKLLKGPVKSLQGGLANVANRLAPKDRPGLGKPNPKQSKLGAQLDKYKAIAKGVVGLAAADLAMAIDDIMAIMTASGGDPALLGVSLASAYVTMTAVTETAPNLMKKRPTLGFAGAGVVLAVSAHMLEKVVSVVLPGADIALPVVAEGLKWVAGGIAVCAAGGLIKDNYNVLARKMGSLLGSSDRKSSPKKRIGRAKGRRVEPKPSMRPTPLAACPSPELSTPGDVAPVSAVAAIPVPPARRRGLRLPFSLGEPKRPKAGPASQHPSTGLRGPFGEHV